MDYKTAVARGRMLLGRSEDAQWELAELTFHMLVVNDPRATPEDWARDLGVSDSHVLILRDVWDRYGSHRGGNGATRTFAEYYFLAKRSPRLADDLEEEAEETGRDVRSVDRDRRHRDRVEETRDLFRDPVALRELLRDREIREVLERELPRKPAPTADKPKEPKDTGRADEHRLVGELTRLRYGLNSLLERLLGTRLSKDARGDLTRALDELEVTTDWMRAYLTSGDRSFEEALRRLLSEESAGPAPASPQRAAPPSATPSPPPADEEPSPPEEDDEPDEAPPRADRPDRRGPRRRSDPTGRPSGRGRRAS